jgi:hypothetical protein
MLHAAAVDPFAPLAANEPMTPSFQEIREPVPVIPVPLDAPGADFHHARFGKPTAKWDYRDCSGRLLGQAEVVT